MFQLIIQAVLEFKFGVKMVFHMMIIPGKGAARHKKRVLFMLNTNRTRYII